MTAETPIYSINIEENARLVYSVLTRQDKVQQCNNHEIKQYNKQDVKKCFDAVHDYLPFANDVDAEAIIDYVMDMLNRHLEKGDMITAVDHKEWYQAATRNLSMRYTQRNIEWLSGKLPLGIVSKLNDITSEIMDGLGDPRDEAFERKGLVMGDVQSGKTNTYTTLCCKAADVGYKIIILLTGTLEPLRRQTQQRLDEGFVGFSSAGLLKQNIQSNSVVGVGLINPNLKVAVFTSTEDDFKESTMVQLNLSISSIKDPIILVTKKNKDILQNLYSWLQKKNAINGVINEPLLLIDDEADNASINTKQDEVTRINGLIRGILLLFTRRTYVGFTATPYANIFINPDDNDLYPRDFIYSLHSPNNYIGPNSVYGINAPYSNAIRLIPVGEKGLKEIPFAHNKDFQIKKIPECLEQALNCFILSCVIRELRGHGHRHMSMLVNVSRFTNVQDSVRDMLLARLFEINTSLNAYSKMPESNALLNKDISSLKTTWINEYQSVTGFEWVRIQSHLESAARSIEIRSINQRNGVRNLNYADNPNGLRLIAVGGNSLSRGLTLEGLCISFFYRQSETYDTLMQMCRWFGYRDGYADLCRVWMTAESQNWYVGISDATDELKAEFEVMKNLKKTPEDFGFLVRNDISGLIVTARNKMRSASDKMIIKSLNGSMVCSSSIYVDQGSVQTNNDQTEKLVQRLSSEKQPFFNSLTGNYVWQNVPKDAVIDFLGLYQYPANGNLAFDVPAIIDMIKSGGDKLSHWDVSFQHGSSKIPIKYGSLCNLKPITTMADRGSYITSDDGCIVQFSSRELASPSNMKEGIYDAKGNPDLTEILRLESEFRATHKKDDGSDNDNYSAKAYLQSNNRRPILVIYALYLSKSGSNIMSRLNGKPPIGVAIGMPAFSTDSSNPESDKCIIKYKATAVYAKLGNDDLDMDDL